MNHPPTACAKCQQAECVCKPDDSPVAIRAPQTSQHDKLLQTSRWRTVSKQVRAFNSVCQELVFNTATEKWQQCDKPATEVHHLSTDLTLFFNWINLVGLCHPHHHKGQGNEDVVQKHYYVASRGLFGAIHQHEAPPAKLKRGEVQICDGGVARVG